MDSPIDQLVALKGRLDTQQEAVTATKGEILHLMHAALADRYKQTEVAWALGWSEAYVSKLLKKGDA